jgi:phosphate starvation-inducible protein PhoH
MKEKNRERKRRSMKSGVAYEKSLAKRQRKSAMKMTSQQSEVAKYHRSENRRKRIINERLGVKARHRRNERRKIMAAKQTAKMLWRSSQSAALKWRRNKRASLAENLASISGIEAAKVMKNSGVNNGENIFSSGERAAYRRAYACATNNRK